MLQSNYQTKTPKVTKCNKVTIFSRNKASGHRIISANIEYIYNRDNPSAQFPPYLLYNNKFPFKITTTYDMLMNYPGTEKK